MTPRGPSEKSMLFVVPADASATDLRQLKQRARASDEPTAEERAFQEGWDAAFAARDEVARSAKRSTPAKRKAKAKTAPADPPKPRGLRGLRESMRLAYVLAGYKPPRRLR